MSAETPPWAVSMLTCFLAIVEELKLLQHTASELKRHEDFLAIQQRVSDQLMVGRERLEKRITELESNADDRKYKFINPWYS